MKHLIALALSAAAMSSMAQSTTSSVTTTERTLPTKCHQEGTMMVCSSTTITAVTTTVTGLAKKPRATIPDPKEGV
jgi:hypothetical protein